MQLLHVGALMEMTRFWYAKYETFFIDILEHTFGEIENRTDILTEYLLKLIPKDTKVIQLILYVLFTNDCFAL